MLAAALALCALGGAPPRSSDVAAVVAVLERSAGRAEVGERLTRELAGLGFLFLPDLLSVLAFGSDLPRPLETAEEDALLDALASFGAPALRPLLQQRLNADAPAEERMAALRILARVGSSDDLALLRRILQGAPLAFAGALQETCTALLRRDPRALEGLRRWMLEAPIEIGSALARALAASACPQALAALAGTIGLRADLDAELLAELAPLVARAPKPLDEDILGPLEEALEEGGERVLRAAALALGHAEGERAAPRLIELLGHESRGVSTAAEWALEHISGLRFHADALRWQEWLRAESAWFEREIERLGAELRARAPEVAIRALGEVSGHRWRRHELALAVAAALEHESALVRRLACTVLARLGSSAAEAALLLALEDPDQSVAQAAWQALESLGLAPLRPRVERKIATLPSRCAADASTYSEQVA